MPKKQTKKTTTHSNKNKNKNTQKVVVNINSDVVASKKKTQQKGTVSYTKGSSYMAGTPLRAVNYGMPTIINNMQPPPMMPPDAFAGANVNRLNSIENLAQSLKSDIQLLHGRLNAPTPQEIKLVMPHLPEQTREVVQKSKIFREMGTSMTPDSTPDPTPTSTPTTTTSSSTSTSTSSSISTPSFGGSSSSGGDDSPPFRYNPNPSIDMNDASQTNSPMSSMSMSTTTNRPSDFTYPQLPPINTQPQSSLSTIKEESSGGYGDESVGSVDTPASIDTILSRETSKKLSISGKQSSNRRNRSDASYDPTIDLNPTPDTTIDVNPSAQTTIDVNPSKGKKTVKVKSESSKDSSSSVNQPSTTDRKFMKLEFDRLMQSYDYINSQETVMTQKERKSAEKQIRNELQAMYRTFDTRSSSTPRKINVLTRSISSHLRDD